MYRLTSSVDRYIHQTNSYKTVLGQWSTNCVLTDNSFGDGFVFSGTMGGYGSIRKLYEFVFDYPLVNQQSHIKSPIFLSNFHQTCRFSMAMLV